MAWSYSAKYQSPKDDAGERSKNTPSIINILNRKGGGMVPKIGDIDEI
jgi:hypothetical protein